MKDEKRKSPLVVGLTGSIGSGKSTAASILHEQYDFPIIDADVLAREVVQPGSDGLKEVIATFGKEYLQDDGNLHRAKLGKLIFNDETAKKSLEDILHPRIRKLYLTELQALRMCSHPGIIAILYVVPLLFESRYDYPEIDLTLCIYAKKQICINRIIARNKISIKEAELRYDSQIPMERKRELADYTVPNEKSIKDLEEGLTAFVEWLKARVDKH